jgi:uncharacterized protein YqeY
MNTLKQSINEKLKTAMKEKNAEMLNVLRGVISKITESEKANSNKELIDDEVIKVIEKLAKQREESIALFKKGNREDLVTAEEFQLNVLKEYLPQKMDEAATRKAVDEAIQAGATNIGMLMKELGKYGNLIDKKLASQIANELIAK